MKPWFERPLEEAYLLNPAFTSLVLTASIIGYGSEKKRQPLPLALSFMVLPIILHMDTRVRLPSTTRTTLGSWSQNNRDVKVGFGARVLALKPYTKEAILFGYSYDWVTLDNAGNLYTSKKESVLVKNISKLEVEVKECIVKARFLGKWFALAGSSQTIMSYWGITP